LAYVSFVRHVDVRVLERNSEMTSEVPVTRVRILKAAARLFAERGYHAVGMTDLQDAVQLKRGALYHHIRGKEDLLYEIARQYISELVECGSRLMHEVPDPAQRVCDLGRDLILKIASNQSELVVCFREVQSLTQARHTDVMKMHTKYERLWRDTFTEGAEAGHFRPFDPIVLKGLLGMYFYSYLWMKSDGPLGPEVIADRLNELSLRMLARTQGASPHATRSGQRGRTDKRPGGRPAAKRP